jgi:hypothetical protein
MKAAVSLAFRPPLPGEADVEWPGGGEPADGLVGELEVGFSAPAAFEAAWAVLVDDDSAVGDEPADAELPWFQGVLLLSTGSAFSWVGSCRPGWP